VYFPSCGIANVTAASKTPHKLTDGNRPLCLGLKFIVTWSNRTCTMLPAPWQFSVRVLCTHRTLPLSPSMFCNGGDGRAQTMFIGAPPLSFYVLNVTHTTGNNYAYTIHHTQNHSHTHNNAHTNLAHRVPTPSCTDTAGAKTTDGALCIFKCRGLMRHAVFNDRLTKLLKLWEKRAPRLLDCAHPSRHFWYVVINY
jgi:hypothetical protein